jgi:Cof subfamily protein (haloacid dehalogenase superfamily)
MIRALFFDLDGTLLNSKKVISPKTVQTLEKCRENNIKLFVATARPPLLDRMLEWDKNILSLFDGGLYYNGGCVQAGGEKEYNAIACEVVKKTIEYVCEYASLNIALQCENEIHAFRFPLSEAAYKRWGVTAKESLTLCQAQKLKLKTVKILVFYLSRVEPETQIDNTLVDSVKTLCADTAQFYLTDKSTLIQITAHSANKLNGVEKILKMLGYGKSEIAVFGDDANDIEMLSECKYSVAMGNAEQYVKQAGKYVAPDNDSDGVHHAICDILRLI